MGRLIPVQPHNRLRVPALLLRFLASPRKACGSALLVAGLAVIEMSGRRLASDVGDVCMFLALGALLVPVILLYRLDGEAIAEGLDARWRRLASRWQDAWPDFGVDFRDDRTIPHRVPAIVHAVTAVLASSAALIVAWNVWVGYPVRSLLVPHFYLGYLVLLSALWTGLLFTALVGIVVASMTVHHALWVAGRPRNRVRRLLGAWFLALLVAGLLLPAEIAILHGIGAILVTMGMVRVLPRLVILWRSAKDGRIAAISWGGMIWQASALPLAAFLVFLGFALGGAWSWWPTPPSVTPLTDGFARLAAWCFGPSFLVHAIAVLFEVKRLAANDPATPCPTTVHVTLETTGDELSRIERLFDTQGWDVRYPPEEPEPTDVRLRLVDSPMPRPLRDWPLPVSARALEVPELLDLIARRDVINRRRLLRRGLKRLLKELRLRKYDHGGGFWIAPHLWYATAVTRDTDEENDSGEGFNNEIGTPFVRLFPLPVRHHLHLVLRVIEVDLLLLEDGVRWSAFRRVIERLFTHYDSGHRRIEERDFGGIVGVRVILHDLQPGGNLGVEGYPEPDYTNLARGRVLHVFKDRGGHEEEPEPVPAGDTGVLVGV